jgi:hypothetical protein
MTSLQCYLSKKIIMRKLIVILAICPMIGYSQGNFGVKAGVNFANVTNAAAINGKNTTGFMVGIFLAPQGKIISSSTELMFSRQGYSYRTNTNTGKVNLNYILMEQMMGISITKFVKIQVGALTGFLINAKADSSSSQGSSSNPAFAMMNMMNRFDYGFAGGVEIYPFKGLLIGGRLNLSMAKAYKEGAENGSSSFMPSINAKNNVVQIYTGYRF